MSEFLEQLPEALREAPYLKSAKTAEEAVQALQNAAAWQGNSLRIPGPDADDETVRTFRGKVIEKYPGLMETPSLDDEDALDAVLSRLGLPEAADKYKMPEGVELPGEQAGQMMAWAHGAKMTQKQFEKYVTEQAGHEAKALEKANDHFTQQEEALKGEWGSAYDQRKADCIKLAEDSGAPPGLLNAIKAGKADGETMRWLFNLHDSLGAEAGELGEQGKDNGNRIMDPNEALSQLAEIEKKLFVKGISPEDKAILTKKRLALMPLAYPTSEDGSAGLRA